MARGIERGEFREVNVPMFVRVITAPLVMLSLWTRSFGPCSGQPVDADAYIRTHVDMVSGSAAARLTCRACDRPQESRGEPHWDAEVALIDFRAAAVEAD